MQQGLVIHAPHDLRIQSLESAPLQPQQLKVKVKAGGICGSDLHYYHHGGFGVVRIKEPMVLGHEVSGQIAEVGSAITDIAPGTRIAISPSRPCGVCKYCQEGKQNHCLDMRFYGSAMRTPHVQGSVRKSSSNVRRPTSWPIMSRMAKRPWPSRCRWRCMRCAAPGRWWASACW